RRWVPGPGCPLGRRSRRRDAESDGERRAEPWRGFQPGWREAERGLRPDGRRPADGAYRNRGARADVRLASWRSADLRLRYDAGAGPARLAPHHPVGYRPREAPGLDPERPRAPRRSALPFSGTSTADRSRRIVSETAMAPEVAARTM